MTCDANLGVPAGTVALAQRLWSTTGGPLDGAELSAAVIELLTAPRRLEPDWPEPHEPVPVGDGWVHTELIDEDRPLFDALLSESDTDPETLATTAQQMRLPVNPYRSLRDASRRPGSGPSHTQTTESANNALLLPFNAKGRTIIDLSTHWAGPLATKLLAEAGATVIKIDPKCRPDGFGSRTSLYGYLNDEKDLIDLDLRSAVARRRFEDLVRNADLVVESFSDRVMINLGYPPATLQTLNPTISTLSIRAFSDGPDAGRLAYGPGVHAASGLGMLNGAPEPAALAYADPLTALNAYRRALELFDGAEPGNAANHVQVSLQESIEPLVAEALQTNG